MVKVGGGGASLVYLLLVSTLAFTHSMQADIVTTRDSFFDFNYMIFMFD